MSRKPGGDPSKSYIHPTTITDAQARALARSCIRDQQTFALVRDGRNWQVWSPTSDEERIVALIESAKEL